MERILGLDCSTSTIGIALLVRDKDKITLDHIEYFKPPKKGDIFDRLAAVYAFIQKKITELKPTEIVMEDIILFMQGRSTAKTISGLAVLNRTVGLAIRNHQQKSPNLMNVMKIRHTLKTTKKLPSKEEIPDLIATALGIDFPWVYKINKKTKKQETIVENYDMADAIAVAYAYLKRNKSK